jgi:signal transduction histidine kinase
VVCGFTTGTSFRAVVSNRCDPIPAASIPGLFQARSRGAVGPDQHGLGLGLYIASIASAHNGTLTASSSLEETRFHVSDAARLTQLADVNVTKQLVKPDVR